MDAVQLRENLHWVGVQDPNLRVFDIIMVSPYGTSYNSYVIKGNGKTALVETAKEKFFDAYLEKLKEVVDPMTIDYLIVDHTEPDHAGSIARLLEVNPYIVVVGSAVAISFLKEIINRDFAYVTVKHNDTLALGDKTLRFFSVPNLHWPDTIYTYVEEDKYLFTCDSFGAHFAAPLLYSQVENHEQYDEAFKYYFDCIMGPYKSFVLKALDLIDPLEVDLVCTGHGPIVDTNFAELKRRYREWSTPKRTHKLPYVVIPYVSAYGYTEQMKDEIIRGLKDVAEMDIAAFDLVEVDAGHVLNEIAQADAVLFGTPTIVAEALKPIWDLTSSMHSVTHRHLYASAFGSYGWSGEGVMHIMDRLHQLHMKTFDGLRIKFRPGEKDLIGCYEWGYEFGCFMLNKQVEKVHKGGKTYVKCLVCGEILEEGLETCPVCGVGKENFVPYIVEEVTFKKDSEQHFVIVGNGNAGVNAAAAIRERNATASITLLSEEPYLGYNRPQLTKQMLGDLEESIPKIKDAQWYRTHNIQTMNCVKVTNVDPTAKKVSLDSGAQIAYDELILATGASCFMPPVENSTLKNVVSIRTLQDVKRVRELLPTIQDVIVIGGGVLGLEVAWEMKKANKHVTVLEVMPNLMPRQLDLEASSRLEEIVRNQHVDIHTNVKVCKIVGSDKVEGVQLEGDVMIPGQLVIFSAGVKANTELALQAGCAVERAIVVNAKMETSVPHIYACGDCAQFEGMNYAIWPEAGEQGRIAGTNAAGDEAHFVATNPAITTNCMGTSLYARGDVGKGNGKYRTLELMDTARKTYEKYYFLNSQLVGVILLGDTSKIAMVDEALNSNKRFDQIFKF